MDNTPFDDYVEEAEEVAETARKRNGIDWEVYVSETQTRLNPGNLKYEQVDGPSFHFDGGIIRIEIWEEDDGWTNSIPENFLESPSTYDELNEAVESAYKVMMNKKPGDVFIP